ncbi:MAG TPA: CSLREA domain-containing protein, partial [Candidatus Binatia bacterium]|nr:CSLREA domain-containing protein [Candidatus Binatia bacterium]
MHRPVINRTHRTLNQTSRIKIRTALKLLTICLIAAVVPFALYVSVKSEDSARFSFFKVKEAKKQVPVTVKATGRGNPFLNVKDGSQMMTVSYRGASGAVSALQTGAAGGRALAAADLDGDAAPDLVAGFANGGTGIVTVQKGNPEGFAPQDDSVFQRMHQGYNPPSLLPTVETYQVSSPVDFLQLGDFNNDGRKDVLIASRDGSLRLLPGDGQGGLGAEQQIVLPGNVTSLTAGEFRAADGRIDVAVGVHGFQGPEVLIFDGAAGGFESTPFQFALSARADSVEFGELDSDPFMDLAIANGSEINIVHGWGRRAEANPQSQVERIPLAYGARSIAVDNFTWDRQGTREIAVLSEDGSVRLLEHSRSDKRALTEADRLARAAARGKATKKNADVEVERGWSGGQGRWSEVNQLQLKATTGAAAHALLSHGKVSPGETNALMVPNGAQRKLEMVRQVGKQEAEITSQSTGDVSTTSLDVSGTPVAMIALPKKLNGVQDVVVLTEESAMAVTVPIEPNAIFSVNTTSDHAPDGACNAAPDCTLREAVIAANTGAGADTINLPAGTYNLTLIGNTNNAGAGEGFAGNAAVGDLDFRDTPEGGCAANKINCFAGTGDLTTLSGAGSGSTFIVQTTANDRVIEPNPFGDLNFDLTISGVTIAGGRDTGGVNTGGGG